MFARHHESAALLNAAIGDAFAYLDDFKQLSAHMAKSSAMMFGSRMTIETDERDGRAVGSSVRMQGTMLGMKLALEEVVVEHEPPRRKVWQTVDARLLVIGQYQLGFDLEPAGRGTRARIFIDYDLPEKAPARWLGRLFARMYARWCTARMAADAAQHFVPRLDLRGARPCALQSIAHAEAGPFVHCPRAGAHCSRPGDERRDSRVLHGERSPCGRNAQS